MHTCDAHHVEHDRRNVNSADRWSDVPAGTMDEASPFRILVPAVSLTARTCKEIGPPHPPDPIMGGPKCRSRREARTLRVTSHTIDHARGCAKCASGEGHRLWVLTLSYAGGRTRQFSL